MNTVIANKGAADSYQATLQDFKSAFSLKGTAFKHTGATKGTLYVKDGKICSANIHGGKGTVSSSVTNLALRNALIDAFQRAGATEEFLNGVRNELFANKEKMNGDLSRSDVKRFIVQFEGDVKNRRVAEQNALESQNAVGMKFYGSLHGVAEKLQIDDFRKLAKGSGNVGGNVREGVFTFTLEARKNVVEEPAEKSWVTYDHDTNNADYNAALRRRLYEVVRDEINSGNLPEDQKFARKCLLQNLKLTLIGLHLKEPLSCDEIRRTLTAFDRNISYISPKVSDGGAVKVSADTAKLAEHCNKLERQAEKIDAFLSSFTAKSQTDPGLMPPYVEALRLLSSMIRVRVDVGRQCLRQDKVDVADAKNQMKRVNEDFIKNNTTACRYLAKLHDFCANGILKTETTGAPVYSLLTKHQDEFFNIFVMNGRDPAPFLKACVEDLLSTYDGVSPEGREGLFDALMPDRAPTLPIEGTSGRYIGEVLNNAGKGDCLFYAVEDAGADNLPSENTTNNLTTASVMRDELAQYIKECLDHVEGQKGQPQSKGFSGLVYTGAGDEETLQIPHSNGRHALFADDVQDLLRNSEFGSESTDIPTEQVAFLASMLKRPIVLLKDSKAGAFTDSQMVCYNRDVMTGKKLEGKPIAIYFGNDHYQAVKLNDAGLAKCAELTKYESIDEAPNRPEDNVLDPDPHRVGAGAPNNVQGENANVRQRAEEFIADNNDAVNRLLDGLPNGSHGEDPSTECRTIFKNVLRYSAESLYAERGEDGMVSLEELSGPGSLFDTIKELVTRHALPVGMATCALSLPPKEANAFLKACLLVPDTMYGTVNRFLSVASQLARLPPSQFTPENVVRLAHPDLAFPPELRQRANLQSPQDQMLLFAPCTDRSGKSLSYAQDHFSDVPKDYAVNMQVGLFFMAGVSLQDMRTILADPKKFSLKMLPESAFLPSVGKTEENVKSAVELLFKDIGRDECQISILRSDGDEEGYEIQEEDAAAFKDQIADLCGRENIVQQQLAILFMTQNAQQPETMMNCCHANKQDNPTRTQYLLKADPATGDVYVSKTTNPELDFGMSVTIRIGKDGSMSVVDLQERTQAGELVPMDGKGLPMNPRQEVPVQPEAPEEPAEPPMMHRNTMRVPEPKWDVFDVTKVKDGHLTPEQLSYLEMNPTKTNGPVTIKFPNDINTFSKAIGKKSRELKGQDLSQHSLKPVGMFLFLHRGDYNFQIGDNQPILQKDIHGADAKDRAVNDLLSQLEELFGEDKLLMHTFNDFFNGYLSLPGTHELEGDAFCFNLDFQTGESMSKSATLSKNSDGSYRISLEIKAENIKGALLNSDMENALKYFKVDGDNSYSYRLTFDLAKDDQGLAVIRPVEGQEPTIEFDLHGCTVTETDRQKNK